MKTNVTKLCTSATHEAIMIQFHATKNDILPDSLLNVVRNMRSYID
jgi:hypothetical protein